MVIQVTDAQIVALHQGRWKPEDAGHYHSPFLWAIWDGRSGRYGLQPGVAELPTDVASLDPEFAAFVAGLPTPSATEIAARGMAAFARWAAAGLPVVSEQTRKARALACQACPLWDAQARWGLGKCNHKSCGCTALKWWLKTEKCPDGWWPKV